MLTTTSYYTVCDRIGLQHTKILTFELEKALNALEADWPRETNDQAEQQAILDLKAARAMVVPLGDLRTQYPAPEISQRSVTNGEAGSRGHRRPPPNGPIHTGSTTDSRDISDESGTSSPQPTASRTLDDLADAAANSSYSTARLFADSGYATNVLSSMNSGILQTRAVMQPFNSANCNSSMPLRNLICDVRDADPDLSAPITQDADSNTTAAVSLPPTGWQGHAENDLRPPKRHKSTDRPDNAAVETEATQESFNIYEYFDMNVVTWYRSPSPVSPIPESVSSLHHGIYRIYCH